MAVIGFPRRPGMVWGVVTLGPALLLSLGLYVRKPAAASAPIRLPVRSGDVLFRCASSSMEGKFAAAFGPSGVEVVALKSLDEAEAHRYQISETPTLIRFDLDGKETSRKVGAREISDTLEPDGHRSCVASRGKFTPNLRWIDEDDPRARQIYRRFRGEGVPDIFKAMSLRPELMEKVADLSDREHFSNGFLDRRTKERIATLVSTLNHSTYCLRSHSEGLRELGTPANEVVALEAGNLSGGDFSAKQKALLEFVRHLTLKPGEIRPADVTAVRAAGWKDEQIFEAAFDASLFAFFNRMAVTYGLEP